MQPWSKQIPFQVDVAGIIQLMGESLYSRRDTPIRELIQNAHDGIVRRRRTDLGYRGRIDIVQGPAAGTLRFEDDGIGLSADEAEQYLGTLGIGITGMIKRQATVEKSSEGDLLIGQFGIGLFSAFMIADRLVVESLRAGASDPVRWEAGAGTDIELSSGSRQSPGTCVTLHLKPEHRALADREEPIEAAVREYANFLPVPIHLNGATARVNRAGAAWFEATPDPEAVEMELESHFQEAPLEIVPIRMEKPVTIHGALYVTPQRVPGFTDLPTVAVTVRRMVIDRKVQGLLPEWAPFIRGVLELTDCSPTASREDLVRDARFEQVRAALDELLYTHFEGLAGRDPGRLAALVAWHRYTLAGAALEHPRLRAILRHVYNFTTSQGPLTFDAVFERSAADPLFETGADRVVWFNPSRRQEQWANTLFAGHAAPCIHTLFSFEESLLGAMIGDASGGGDVVELRPASPGTEGFAAAILGIRDMEEAPPEWRDFLGIGGATVYVASFDPAQPVMAFLNERTELRQTLEHLKKQGSIPAGFQRMIDKQFADDPPQPNEIVLNRRHRLVGRALDQATGSALASVLRLLVSGALSAAGMVLDRDAHRQQEDDLQWIAEALWGRET